MEVFGLSIVTTRASARRSGWEVLNDFRHDRNSRGESVGILRDIVYSGW